MDDEAMAKAGEIIALLSDPGAYEKRLAELRGIAASADRALADAKASAARHANADRLVADATALLARQG